MPRLQAPIILVHGLFGFGRLRVGRWMILDYFNGIPAVLESGGNRVTTPFLSPTGSIATRAAQLKSQILQHYPDEPVHVIAHSMGGLDARYMISKLDMANQVLSLTTLGTPHRGSPFADWATRGLVHLVAPFFDMLHWPREAFHDLTVARCKQFNEQVLDRPEVRYFAVAGRYAANRFNPTWHISGAIVEKAEGPNDGIVSISSATWGENCDVWEGDHVSLINWPEAGITSRSEVCFEHYAGLLRRLSAEGF